MSTSTAEQKEQETIKPFRIWPVAAILILMLVVRFGILLIPDASFELMFVCSMGPALGAVLILLWWLTFSRAKASERILGLVGLILFGVVSVIAAHPSMRGQPTIAVALPLGLGGFGLFAIFANRFERNLRLGVAMLGALLGFGFYDLLRGEGVWGDLQSELHWRWTPTPEKAFAEFEKTRDTLDIDSFQQDEVEQGLNDPEWPGFRGAERDGIVRNLSIDSDWKSHPPDELWRIRVGPGWSSFAVASDLLYTQEQRSEYEAVVCYDANSGAQVWEHEYQTRFEESMGGPGPRATPTIAHGDIFALGATGILKRLNARDGSEKWKVDLQEIAKRRPPMWGFASSPLVTEKAVVVHAGGDDELGIIAFDVETGDLIWSAASGNHSYASPQLTSLFGEASIAMLSNDGLTFLSPETGDVLFNVNNKFQNYRALQPIAVTETNFLFAGGPGTGTLRVDIEESEDHYQSEIVWTARYLRPDFNDFVFHDNHIYGFDRNIFCCTSFETGERKWTGGRYGSGQVILIKDSSLLLVSTEQGEIVLLSASPYELTEVARYPVFDGKTWNHPVLVGDRLYLRNAEEATCLKLKLDSNADDPNDALTQD